MADDKVDEISLEGFHNSETEVGLQSLLLISGKLANTLFSADC